jgi:hypothetical protein
LELNIRPRRLVGRRWFRYLLLFRNMDKYLLVSRGAGVNMQRCIQASLRSVGRISRKIFTMPLQKCRR